MIDFTGAKAIITPEGSVKKITRKNDGSLIWEKAKKYTNVLPLAQMYSSNAPYVGADGSKGYGNNMRFSSSSPSTTYMKALTGVDTTALIPVKIGNVLRFKNCNIKVNPSNTTYGTLIYGFDSNKTIINAFNCNMNTLKLRLPFVKEGDEYVQITIEPTDEWRTTSPEVLNVAYINIGTDGLDETSIITINEEIT